MSNGEDVEAVLASGGLEHLSRSELRKLVRVAKVQGSVHFAPAESRRMLATASLTLPLTHIPILKSRSSQRRICEETEALSSLVLRRRSPLCIRLRSRCIHDIQLCTMLNTFDQFNISFSLLHVRVSYRPDPIMVSILLSFLGASSFQINQS